MHHFGIIVVVLTALLVGIVLGVGAATYLILGLVVGVVGFSLAILIGEYVSADAGATRAASAGRVGEALERFVPGKMSWEIARFLADALPEWDDAQRALQRAVTELTDLQRAIAEAHLGSASQALLRQLAPETRIAAAALWRSADRLGAVAAQRGDSEGIRRGVERELAKLDRITTALHTARVGLAELALAEDRDGSRTHTEEMAEIHLLALGQAARELAAMERRDVDGISGGDQ